MPNISAANNLTVQHDATRWRLYNGKADEGITLAAAEPGGLTYGAAFAEGRRLPTDGFLAAEEIVMVAVGWAEEDANWHLGLLLAPALAQARGGRWCGLARWEDQDGDLAERAGQALAMLLSRPFRLVPPVEDAPLPAATTVRGTGAPSVEAVADLPPAADAPLMPLPLELEEWTVQAGPHGLRIAQSEEWRRALLMRVALLAALVPVFALLSLGALTTRYASVSPEWLPYLGLGIAALLLASLVTQLLALLRGPVTQTDNGERILRQTARVGRRTLVQVPFEGVQYVLISHVINRRRAQKTVDEIGRVYAFWGEMWVHVYAPRKGFIEICHVTDMEGRAREGIAFSARRALDFSEIDSPAHHAAAWLARDVDVPVYVEAR
jgi:membrane protein implicated in regulation of membrane protease activity